MHSYTEPISLAVFVPQSRAPSKKDLDRVRLKLTQDERCRPLLASVHQLEATYDLLCVEKAEIKHLAHGRSYARMLAGWIDGGVSSTDVARARSAIHSLPLLAMVQLAQFLEYLDVTDTPYSELLSQVRSAGGLQGYCGGLAAAIAIASSQSVEQAVDRACAALHVTFATGLVAELGDDSRTDGVTTIVARLKYEGQADEIVKLFPHTYVGAVNDSRSITIVGPSESLAELRQYVVREGMQVQEMDIRGKTHNPENMDLAAELAAICHKHAHLTLPQATELQTPLRSNKDGSLIVEGSLTASLIETVLATRCEWLTVVNLIADDLAHCSDRESHKILSFGIGDCLTMAPFHRRQVKCNKVDVRRLLAERSPLSAADQTLPSHAVAVIGLSCRYPGAEDFEQFWQLVSQGIDTHRDLTTERFDLLGSFRATQSASFTEGRRFMGNFLDDVKSADRAFFGYNSKEMLHMDPQQRLLLELAHEAIESSGLYNREGCTLGSDVGCFIGASYVDYVDNTSSHATTAYNSTGTLRTFMSGRLSYKFGWHGPSEVIDTACSSSLVAINRAYTAIQNGECRVAVTGGVNIISSINNYLDLARTGFLSPTGQCKPFDQSADGYCRSEGGGLIILKPYAAAVADGDAIFGVLRGTSTNHGSSDSSITTPNAKYQTELYRRALNIAELEPHEVSYVEAHGTGTQAGDSVEMLGIRSILGGASRSTALSVGSIKANIGHAETAAGVAGVLKVLAMLQRKSIPPLAKHKKLNPKIPALEPDRITIDTKLRSWDVPYKVALVNSYGAAGCNATCICSEAPTRPRSASEEDAVAAGETYPIILSAASPGSLRAYAAKLSSYLSKAGPSPTIGDVAFTLSERRKRFKYCMMGTSSTTDGILRDLTVSEWTASEKPVVFCFSGQGSKVPQLHESFLKKHPTFRVFVRQCDDLLAGMGFPLVSPVVYRTKTLDETDIVSYQISHVVMQLAVANYWVASGLRFQGVIGHSLGELAALGFCEVLSLPDCLRLVGGRARLMEKLWGKNKGSMLAIHADEKFVRNIIANVTAELPGSTLEIACYNSPASHVVAGSSDAVALAESLLENQKTVKFQRIKTSHAFHSALITDAIVKELDDLCATLTWREPKYPLDLCSEEPTTTASTMAYSPSKHARQAVYFSHAIRRLESRLGPSLWIEAGVNGPVVPMVRSALHAPEDHEFIRLVMEASTNPSKLLSETTVKLWKLGFDVQPWQFVGRSASADSPYRTAWLPPYQFDRSEFWLENIDRAKLLLDPSFVKSQESQATGAPVQVVEAPKSLVTPLGKSPDGNYDFRIHTTTDRFQRLTKGHAVQGQAMCPASLYLECVSMAFQSLADTVHRSGVACARFDSVSFSSPLKMDVTRIVEIRMTSKPLMSNRSFFSYDFTISSRLEGSAARAVTHCKGTVSAQAEISLVSSTRLLLRTMDSFFQRNDLEKLGRKRAYKLFSRVVDYEDFFQGISTIGLTDSEACADIKIADRDICSIEGPYINAVTADCFVQVAGLLSNSSDDIGQGEVLLAGSFDKVEFLLPPRAGETPSSKEWKVFAQISPSSHNKVQYAGDVYAFTENNELAAVFEGCRFDKTTVDRLKKILGASGSPTVDAPRTVTAMVSRPVAQVPIPAEAPIKPFLEDDQKALAMLKKILMSQLDLSSAEFDKLDRGCAISDLGVDSLASVEIATELSACGIQIDGPTLMERSLGALEKSTIPKPVNGSMDTNRTNGIKVTNGLATEATQKAPLLKKILMSHLDLSSSEYDGLDRNCAIGDIGVDSLASVEIATELATCGIQIDGPTLMERSLGDLEKSIPPKHSNSTNGVNGINGINGRKSANGVNGTNGINATNGTNGIHTPKMKESHQSAADTKNALRSIISGVIGIESSSIPDDVELQDLGVDSLCLIELKTEFVKALAAELGDDDITFESTISTIIAAAGIPYIANGTIKASNGVAYSELPSNGVNDGNGPSARMSLDVLQALDVTNANFDIAARQCGYSDYWDRVSPILNGLVVKYIAKAFKELGVDLEQLPLGSSVPSIPYLPKHTQVVKRHYEILEQHSIVESSGAGGWVRGSGKIPEGSIAHLHAEAIRQCPQYKIDIELMATTGDKLAGCLTGKENPVALLFGNPRSRDLLNQFYRVSPMLNTLTEQLLVFMSQLVKSGEPLRPLRILEVGAGTGGTTSRLAPLLQSIAPPEQYTFTDISSTLTRQAANEFGRFKWMDYRVFNLEQDVPSAMRGKYDLAVATNCVHATRSRAESLGRIYDALTDEGIVVLSEQTRIIDWYDIVFGLLDGWWYSDGGKGYPIRTPVQWDDDFKAAGFSQLSYTGSASLESISQQLLIGTKSELTNSINGIAATNGSKPGRGPYDRQVFEYKMVDTVSLQADVFLPQKKTTAPMPMCLMIHGGGYMSLSRKSIRLPQVTHLLANGVMPVSIDYRLCPGVGIVDGPMMDVRDAYIWMTTCLPSILSDKGIQVDPSRVGVVGWSTGGQLAMSLAWSLGNDHILPKAIVPFYSPVDFENINSDIAPPEYLKSWEHSMSLEEALQAIPNTPVTAYHGPGSNEPVPPEMREMKNLGFMHENDARSGLIALLFQDPKLAQPLLFYGKDKYKTTMHEAAREEVLARISPLANLRAANYKTPTLLVHGDKDEIAPFVGAHRFSVELTKQGIDGGLLKVAGSRHLFDLRLVSGSKMWREAVAPAYEFLLQHLH
ncbi:hypothetical protein THARTR1_08106 [Trichoderma harzianum]|uniref:Uncharacterized protein n=1 Tax=Trichoderma harzianum TaxID=5544 RepID=A0A2K0U0B1_TRIHA|nr:hypothetical protein THARTR1_08106 [Trichoderma harzianum]